MRRALAHSMSPLARVTTVAVLALACSAPPPPVEEPRPEPLMTAALAGQSVIVPPITMVIAEPGVPGNEWLPPQAALPRWADSLVAEALTVRAPEVQWVLPEELRRVARRAPGVVPDPDQMGQAVLRSPGLRSVPDPLRGYLRNLMALAGGGRHAFVPALVLLEPDLSGGVRARLALVLADGRSGAVVWRTEAVGQGAEPAAAVSQAMAAILPILQP